MSTLSFCVDTTQAAASKIAADEWSVDSLANVRLDTFETNILVDKFEIINGEWTFETKTGYWMPLRSSIKNFLNDLAHFASREDTTKNDLLVLIDFAVTKHKWKINVEGCEHNPISLDLAKLNPKNYSTYQDPDLDAE
jgi:hypothetical protein